MIFDHWPTLLQGTFKNQPLYSPLQQQQYPQLQPQQIPQVTQANFKDMLESFMFKMACASSPESAADKISKDVDTLLGSGKEFDERVPRHDFNLSRLADEGGQS